MPQARRPVISDQDTLAALAHPVRLDVLNHLMASGPATASACARAVGDTPSNCSYHLRTLARFGLVEPDESADGRERPWRATITGFTVPDGADGTDGADRQDTDHGRLAFEAAALASDQRQARDYLARRSDVPARWRQADAFDRYTLSLTPAELEDLLHRVDALVRPYIAATRDDAPRGSGLVNVTVQAYARAVPGRPKPSTTRP